MGQRKENARRWAKGETGGRADVGGGWGAVNTPAARDNLTRTWMYLKRLHLNAGGGRNQLRSGEVKVIVLRINTVSYHLKTQFMFGAKKSRCIRAHPHSCIHVGRMFSSTIHTMGLSCLETIIILNSWVERCKIVRIMLCSIPVTRIGFFHCLECWRYTWGRLLMETVQLDMLLQPRVCFPELPVFV